MAKRLGSWLGFLVMMLVAGFGTSTTACMASDVLRPNIIVVLADDLGYSDLGCYGGEISTPNIDALAAGGVRFSQMYNSARCCPTRASLMTGLYPTQAGIGDFTSPKPDEKKGPGYLGRLRDECATIAEMLKAASYRSYYVGKWHMHSQTGPIDRGFDEFYGYTSDHSHDQYDRDYYQRLPANHPAELKYSKDDFYATNAFNDYAMEFIRQGQKSGSPWLVFLAHSSPHFPIQAPPERVDQYEQIFLKGWDKLRDERFARMQKMGLASGPAWQLSPRSIVPVDKSEIANGYPGQKNPDWDSLPEDRRRDLARRMAVYAAMVESVDQGVGHIVQHLKETNALENTLILFTSDNGACYEWGPFGFDGTSRKGETILHIGEQLRKIGARGSDQSYGSGWANLCNTPLRMYKHFTHEGGINSPFIAHWPKGFGPRADWVHVPVHVMDIVPTILAAANVSPLAKRGDTALQPIEGKSLLPAIRGEKIPERGIGFDHQSAHAWRKGDWKIVWSKRMPTEIRWELYNIADDRCEMNDLATKYPDRVQEMTAEWTAWARRVGVIWEEKQEVKKVAEPASPVIAIKQETVETPKIANRSVSVAGKVNGGKGDGVVVAHGGSTFGYAVHVLNGKLAFDLRVGGEVQRIVSKNPVGANFSFEAKLSRDQLQLTLGDATSQAENRLGLISNEPKDGLTIGLDEATPAGDYQGPNPYSGTITEVRVQTGQVESNDKKAKKQDRPFLSELITEWGEKVTADNAWRVYPRPQMRRDNWTCLNGNWDYAVTPIEQKTVPTNWNGKILVPFSLESKLGGVQRMLDVTEALWYHRSFVAKKSTLRVKLNFEAVDYRCEVFVNGKSVGINVGGNLPFGFDVTDALRDGENDLVVRVEDATEEYQLRGKQKIEPKGIWYTQVSGIWQTVWLEEVPALHFQDLRIATDAQAGTIRVAPIVSGSRQIKVEARDGETVVAQGTGSEAVLLTVPNAKLWSPASPHLYDLKISLLDNAGTVVDTVTSYAGIRSVGKAKDAAGHWRFTLNGKPIFHWGPLDQGWWPDGLLTPPSENAMLFDIEWLKAAGFNMIRKHIKVEPRLYYYHCDRLGMMVWQDQVSGGVGRNKAWPEWTRLKPNPADASWPAETHQQFMAELDGMISSLGNHPSIVCWVPFNEAWGQHQTLEVGKWTVKRDPSRLVNAASGGNFWPVGDVVDEHRYPHPGFPFELNENGRFDDYIKVVGEFGGHGFPIPNHIWDANRRNWGYGDLPKTLDELKERYVTSIKTLNDLRGQGIAAGVYTQTTDVEGEVNGLMTYDRKAFKIAKTELAELHKVLFVETPKQAAKADQFEKIAFVEKPTDRKPGPVMSTETIRAGLKSHDKALFIKAGWIRDPYIMLGPDGYFYLTGTQPNEGDPREAKNPYNIGLGDESIVGNQVRVYRSQDLIEWESLGVVFTQDDFFKRQTDGKKRNKDEKIWAPELHWMGDRWALVHCPKQVSSLALTSGKELKGPWTHPMKGGMGERHDPSLFQDDDNSVWLLSGNTVVEPLSKDLSSYLAKGVRIDPSGSRLGPNGESINRIGHEGATMMKVDGKYVHLGTAWSTDKGRKGSYNLYYSVAEKMTGPFGPRQFAGRFLGHGTPFRDKDGKWWCTAFFNANVPPLPQDGIEKRYIGDDAHTINEQGVTIVPLDVRTLSNGEVIILAKDPAYATPGPDESQKF